MRPAAAWLITARTLRHGFARNGLTAAGIALGVALVFAMAVISRSAVSSFRDSVERVAGKAALEVSGASGGIREEILSTIRRQPGVAEAVPLVTGTIYLDDEGGEAVALFGIDVTDERAVRQYHPSGSADVIEDPLVFLNDPEAVLLGEDLARRRGLHRGDRLAVLAPTGRHRLRIENTLGPSGVLAAFGGQVAVMDIYAAQQLLGKQGRVDQIDLVLAPGASPSRVARALEKVLPESLDVGRPLMRTADIERMLRAFRIMLSGIAALVLVVAGFMVYNTTEIAVRRELRQFGVLRACGATRRGVQALVTVRLLVLGSLGCLVGLPLGWALARLLQGAVVDTMGMIYTTRVDLHLLAATPGDALRAALLGLAAAAVGCWRPAARLAATPPVALIRDMLLEHASGRRTLRVVLAAAGLALTALFIEVRWGSILFGNLAAVLAAALFALLGAPVVTLLARGGAPVLQRSLGPVGVMASGHLPRNPRGTGVAAAGLALALAVMLTVAALVESFQRSIAGYVRELFPGELLVASAHNAGGWLESPLEAALAEKLLRIDGVARVEELRLAKVKVRGDQVALVAASESLFDPARHDGWFREGDPQRGLEAVRTGRGVLVSQNFALHYGTQVGDRLDLPTPQGVAAFTVVGVVADYISDRGTVFLGAHTYRRLWHDLLANRFDVFLAPGAQVERVRESIAGQLGRRYGLKVLTVGELVEDHTRRLTRAFRFMDGIEALLILTAILGLLQIQVADAIDRRREIGVFRAVGARRADLRHLLLAEGATVASAGLLLGVAGGLVLSAMWVRINMKFLLGWILAYHFPYGSLAGGAVLAGTAALAASVFPPLWVATRPVVEALHND